MTATQALTEDHDEIADIFFQAAKRLAEKGRRDGGAE